jgi:hypothetical protein
MSWAAMAERITARAYAARAYTAQAEAEAERIRAQAGIERAKAAAEMERARQQDHRVVAAERQAKRQQRRTAVVEALRSNAAPVAAIGAPAVIAWRGQFEFAQEMMHLGILSPLLPVAIEGSYLYTAMLAHQALEAGVPAGRYRAVTWALAGVAAGQPTTARGAERDECSAPGPVRRSVRGTSGVTSVLSSIVPAWWARSGPPGNCVTASSCLSAHDVPIESISRLVGHTNTVVTETVYRKQVRPVIQEGATAMNEIFPSGSTT